MTTRSTGDDTVDTRIREAVEWRRWLWAPAVRWLLGDPERFRGKRVLELGCRYGKMSCLFGRFGAEVLGVDLEETRLDRARAEAAAQGLGGPVRFRVYDGDPGSLDEGEFDFVFSKSVLVVVPELGDFLRALRGVVVPGAELMLAENAAGNAVVNRVRRLAHPRWKSFERRFHGVDDAFLEEVDAVFPIEERRRFGFAVHAIRARNSRPGDP